MIRGDLYLVSLDPAVGHEQQGVRPVIIVSPDQFNSSGTPLVVPVTSGGAYARTRGFTVSLSGAGTKTTGVVLCNQPRSLDLVARNAKWLEQLPDDVLDQVLDKLLLLFDF